MYAKVEKSKASRSQAVANSVGQKKSEGRQGVGFVDNRPEAVAQRKLLELANNNLRIKQLSQLCEKSTSRSGVVQLGTVKRNTRKKKNSFNNKKFLKAKPTPLQIKSTIRKILHAKVWTTMMKVNSEHTEGDHKNRGQETNNILHTKFITVVKRHNHSLYNAFLRHLCSVLINGLNEHFVEVQAAVTFNSLKQDAGTIYVSANAHPSDLKNSWVDIRAEAEKLKNQDGLSKRLARHSSKLINEIDKFKDKFNIQIVTTGVENQHAETRIDDQIKDSEAIYGGLRRPCGACRINFQLKNRSNVLPAHTGQLWTTKAASISIINYAIPIIFDSINKKKEALITKDNIKSIAVKSIDDWLKDNKDKFTIDKQTYIQEGETFREARGHDTDSESDNEEE